MTRRSERELERALENMEARFGGGTGEDIQVLMAGRPAEDVDAEYVGVDGEPAELDPEAAHRVVIREEVVETDWEGEP